MRILLLCLALVFTRSAMADDDATAGLIGAWRLVSFQVKVVGDETPAKEVFGPHPFGRIVFSPERYVIVLISRSDRRPPSNESESAALLSSMVAYSGKFRIEGNTFITRVDGAWNEVFKGTEQVRYFDLAGDMLTIRTPEQESAILIGNRTAAALVWERERD
jgi:hypothetical protein